MKRMTTGIVASREAANIYCHSIILKEENCVIPTVIGRSCGVEIRIVATVYSFQALIKTKIRAVTIPGAAMGIRTLVKAPTVPQPSINAACSISGEIETKVPRSSQIAKA